MADTKKPIGAADFYGLVNEDSSPKKTTKISSETFASALQNAPKEEGMPWSDVAVKAVTNIPESGLNFAKDLYESIIHPQQTAEGAIDLLRGGLAKIIPKSMQDPRQQANIERGEKAVNAVADFFKERYGSAEKFKTALANDPVSVASDLSMVLSAGGTGVSSYGKLANKAFPGSKVAKAVETAGSTISTAGDYLNPLTAAGKVAATVGKPLLGMTTGVGSENIANAAKAGFQGDRTFVEQMRKQAPMNEPLDNARHNLNVMRQKRSNAYRSGMSDVSKDKTILDFADIEKAVDDAEKSISYGSKIKDDVAFKHLQEMKGEIADWKSADPTIYHTPEGLDALKQRIGAINNRIPYEEANSNRVGSHVYNSIKDTISTQAPKYAEVMGDYSQASDTLQEIEKALSLGNRASADTALRKLQSLTRNNVNTNYGNRLSLAQQLEAEGGKPFINALSGQAMSSPTARGLAGSVENLTAIGGLAHPAVWGALPFQTPRVVGEGLYAGGRAARGVSDVANSIGLNPTNANALADLLYIGEQNRQEGK